MYSVQRVRSTQKLPIVLPERRAKPRISATASAMPVAADTKLCTVSPAIWVRLLIVDSGVYDCQLVLVMKLTDVLNARSGETASKLCGFSGSSPCRRCNAYSTTKPARLNDSMAMA